MGWVFKLSIIRVHGYDVAVSILSWSPDRFCTIVVQGVSITMLQKVLGNASEPNLPFGNIQRLTRTHDNIGNRSHSILKTGNRHMRADHSLPTRKSSPDACFSLRDQLSPSPRTLPVVEPRDVII